MSDRDLLSLVKRVETLERRRCDPVNYTFAREVALQLGMEWDPDDGTDAIIDRLRDDLTDCKVNSIEFIELKAHFDEANERCKEYMAIIRKIREIVV